MVRGRVPCHCLGRCRAVRSKCRASSSPSQRHRATSSAAMMPLAVPDHTTLSRRAETLDIVRSRPGSGPVHLLVDRSWRKLHIAVDADIGQIAAAALTSSDVDDASPSWGFARSGGWPGCFVRCRRCLRSGRRLWRGRRAVSRGVGLRPTTLHRRAERHSAHAARRASVTIKPPPHGRITIAVN